MVQVKKRKGVQGTTQRNSCQNRVVGDIVRGYNSELRQDLRPAEGNTYGGELGDRPCGWSLTGLWIHTGTWGELMAVGSG